jgi:hypothetical protein
MIYTVEDWLADVERAEMPDAPMAAPYNAFSLAVDTADTLTLFSSQHFTTRHFTTLHLTPQHDTTFDSVMAQFTKGICSRKI